VAVPRGSQLATKGTYAMPPVSQNDALEPLVTDVAGAQRMLDAGHQKIWDLLNAGELESFRLGRARRITIQSIRSYIQRKVAEAASPKNTGK
jgi:hypothetical protein